MSITLSQLLIEQGYINNDHYNYALQIQQEQPPELRQPLIQIYLEQEFIAIEHVNYCLSLRNQYLQANQDE